MKSTLSVLGLYKYRNDIFDGFRVPENVSRETCLNKILLETAELESLFTEPDILKFAITTWTETNYKIWEKLNNTTTLEYNPIENYNRTEKRSHTENENRDLKDTENSKYKQNNIGSENTENTVNSTTGEKQKNVAFNETDAKLFQETENNGETSTRQNVNSNENIESGGDVQRTNKGNIERKYNDELNAFGNIGVTTTQEMIKQEREVSTFNIINFIVADFKKTFCLLLY